MDSAHFLKLSTTVCNDLQSWIEEARRQALLSENHLLTLSDAAGVIDRAVRTLAANTAGAQEAAMRAGASGEATPAHVDETRSET
jgi:hypothetical protein